MCTVPLPPGDNPIAVNKIYHIIKVCPKHVELILEINKLLLLHLIGFSILLWLLKFISPIWTYGIELWGCACKSNIVFIQSKILRAIVDAPRYVTNDMIHKDLGSPTVQEVIHEISIKPRTNLESHSNPLLQPLPRDNVIRKLKRRRPAEL